MSGSPKFHYAIAGIVGMAMIFNAYVLNGLYGVLIFFGLFAIYWIVTMDWQKIMDRIRN